MHHALTPILNPADVRQARQQLNNTGEVSAELLGPVLARSWQRSAAAGLVPQGRMPGAPHASAPQLARALEHQRELVAHARPVMEFLYEQTRDTGSMVVLANAEGMLLHALGDGDFIHRAERVALRPGANWHERWRGTNAVGTALAEDQALVVHAGEHFLDRNGFLTCAAAPIHDPSGRLLGALDLSGDHRGFHRHTLGLVRSAVRMIEHRLFDTRHAAGLRLRLHSHPEGIATLTESLLALSEDGWVTGANDAALTLLGLGWQDIGAVGIDQLLHPGLAHWLEQAQRPGAGPQPARAHDGRALWVRVEPGRHSITVTAARPVAAPAPEPEPPHPVQQPADALAALDTGDPALRTALERARRVLDKPIALLLLGESGVGKEVFARAVHASGPRRQQPMVAVNCAALPETLIEAELFGYRPGAFTGASRDGAPGRIREADGGTLFLDEIGDLPLPMQVKLLRVLQERTIERLGGQGKEIAINVRLVAATHHDLHRQVELGLFRADLMYRLNVIPVHLPPLRERSEDLPELVRHLVSRLNQQHQRNVSVGTTALALLCRHDWPGNIRQLANVLERLVLLSCDGELAPVRVAHALATETAAAPPAPLASPAPAPAAPPRTPDPALPAAAAAVRTEVRAYDWVRPEERSALETVLQRCGGNRARAARELGLTPRQLSYRLKVLGVV